MIRSKPHILLVFLRLLTIYLCIQEVVYLYPFLISGKPALGKLADMICSIGAGGAAITLAVSGILYAKTIHVAEDSIKIRHIFTRTLTTYTFLQVKGYREKITDGFGGMPGHRSLYFETIDGKTWHFMNYEFSKYKRIARVFIDSFQTTEISSSTYWRKWLLVATASILLSYGIIFTTMLIDAN